MEEWEPREFSADELRGLRQKLQERRRRQMQAGRIFVGVLLALVGAGVLFRVSPDWWMPGVGIVALLGLVFRMTHWRCPACGEALPLRGSGSVCLGCGLPLDTDDG